MGSRSPYFLRMISRQSSQLSLPVSSTSNSLASCTTSDFLTSKPSALRMTLSSWQVMKEVLWGSNSSKASRTSTSCSPASSARRLACLPWATCRCIQIITKTIHSAHRTIIRKKQQSNNTHLCHGLLGKLYLDYQYMIGARTKCNLAQYVNLLGLH